MPPPVPYPPMPRIDEESEADNDINEGAMAKDEGTASETNTQKARKGSWLDALMSGDQSELRKLQTAVEDDQLKREEIGLSAHGDTANTDQGFLRAVFESVDSKGCGSLRRVDFIKALRKDSTKLHELLKLPMRLSQSDGSMEVSVLLFLGGGYSGNPCCV